MYTHTCTPSAGQMKVRDLECTPYTSVHTDYCHGQDSGVSGSRTWSGQWEGSPPARLMGMRALYGSPYLMPRA